MVDAGTAVVSVAPNITLALHCPVIAFTVMLAGQLITGARPLTVTVNEQVADNPAASVTVIL